MTPKDYKGKTVFHAPTNTSFVVVGGQKRRSGKCFLKDESDNLYPMEECQIVEINQLEFDIRKLQNFATPNQFSKYFDKIGQDRFITAWAKLEENPVDAATAAVAAGYCDNWQDFCVLANSYGVDKESSLELNQRFRSRLKEKGLDRLVATWHEKREAA
ncbi:MAG TPA: hypothetical protein V6D33_07245 [Cyanophyceae cyanobacterium]